MKPSKTWWSSCPGLVWDAKYATLRDSPHAHSYPGRRLFVLLMLLCAHLASGNETPPDPRNAKARSVETLVEGEVSTVYLMKRTSLLNRLGKKLIVMPENEIAIVKVSCLGIVRACLILITLMNSAALALAANYDVFLFAGQSNMDGRGKAAELSAEEREPSKQVIIFYRNPPHETESWQALAPGYSVAAGYKKEELPSPTFGPEIGAAMVLIDKKPHQQFAFIKASKGGTSLSKDWNPDGGLCYSNLIKTVTLALSELEKNGDKGTLRGLFWHQGESDAGSTEEVYLQRLTAFIARVRTELHEPDLPVVVGEVYDNGKRDSVRKAQRAVVTAVPHVGFASAEGLKTSDNGTHFDTASQLTLGQRLAEAMLMLLK